MPTPIKYFIQVAHKWGNIDPDDNQAVEDWFLNDFPKLPKKDINSILDELIRHNNEVADDPGKIIYPSKVPLPLFKDIIPVAGFSLKNSYREFINYIRYVINSRRNSKT